jgi:hypothetical protein
MIRREYWSSRARQAPIAAVGLSLVLLAGLLTACSSTNAASSAGASSTAPPIPPAAFRDHTGVTATSITIGNVTTQTAGLFTGAVVGTVAYADYVNSQGGVGRRKIVVSSADDRFQGALNKQVPRGAEQAGGPERRPERLRQRGGPFTRGQLQRAGDRR